MKSIAESMHNFDRENFQRVAAGLPEMQDEQALKRRRPRLRRSSTSCSASCLPYSRCWPTNLWKTSTRCVASGCWRSKRTGSPQLSRLTQVCGLRENRKTIHAITGTVRRRCRSEEAVAVGLPDASELVEMVYQYCRTRGQYPDAESYPWPEHKIEPLTLKHKACYWMVTGLYADMRANGLSDTELRRKAQDELLRMVRRLNAGK